ncbi:MAG: Mu transposase C-terminal domain-containing protein [Magnetococcales bacterium]|nr:Mu transposase C-terminal domain-containing protein [Magnetococcales bacterium]
MSVLTDYGLPANVSEWVPHSDLIGKYGFPSNKGAFSRHIKDSNWRRPEWENIKWRKRQGKGGGYEYHYSLLPLGAMTAWLKEQVKASKIEEPEKETRREELWEGYDRLPEKKKQAARERLSALLAVEAMIKVGHEVELAYGMIAKERKASISTLYKWRAKVRGIRRDDWLVHLVDRRAGGNNTGSECSEEAWEFFKADYLRLERPSAESCYRRLQRVGAEKGWRVPCLKTLSRKIAREIPVEARVLCRDGQEEVNNLYPPQRRSKLHLAAMAATDVDGHRWDLWVRWPDGEVMRPCMVAIRDVFSGKFLSWRIDKSENREAFRLAFGDVVENWGIPEAMYMDNGRAFASKWMTGGVATRYRWKVREDDPTGVLKTLGVEVHWTTPYSGQSKPIERAFRDFCDNIAKHPAFAGAWTGNSPENKPENYGSRAVDLEVFLEVVTSEIREHNARPGRRTETCDGRSFDETFAESYAKSVIRRASVAQRRLWLMAAEGVTASRKNGEINLMGNRYWDAVLRGYRGEKLIVRFDPQALKKPLSVYRLDNVFLCEAACIEDAGFNDVAAAQEHGRDRNRFRKATKDMVKAMVTLKPEEVAAMIPSHASPDGTLEPGVMRLVTGPVVQNKPIPERSAEEKARLEEVAKRLSAPKPVVSMQTATDRYRRAAALEISLEAGEAVTDRDYEWLELYTQSAEYRSQKRIANYQMAVNG